MAQAKAKPLDLTPDEYLAGELLADYRSEFINGVVYAMSGVSEEHNDITMALVRWLGDRLPAGCRIFSQSVKLKIKTSSHDDFYYPDVFVSCGPKERKGYVREDATVVFEVLSPTTERVDRGEKFYAYQSLSMLHEYLLMSQDETRVEVFRRRNGWKREVYHASDVIALESIGHSLLVADIYRNILP